ncbi:two-component system response regulator YesN [Paenibacillus taihuensis]|uniref:Two-component system response regulator YesN n=1 Tax=Paenibacillus taihuensis TaxID=1156355 RepID=A0A3D9SKY2_9BACL|nr:response regulator [Paenibacillus taihuensis]REE91580.1 two-component system response regulator YesN [Paenibacillus taihuensis]
MKVMIVDDEPYLREGLRIKIGKMNLGLTVVGEAGDGQEAIEKLPVLSPDIVLTDIRMPVADGLTFIREAKERYEGSHFIIISGYEDFDYAKKGIQYDVQDYILKPVDTDELRESLMRMMSKIAEERKRASAASRLAIRNEEISRQTELTRIVQQLPGIEGGEREGRTELPDAFARSKSFVAIVYELQPVKLPHRSFEKGDEELLFFAVMNMISELLETPERRGLLFRHAIEERRLVYVLADIRYMNAVLLAQDLTKVIDDVRNYLSLGITVGCGRIVSSQCRINSSYYQAARASRPGALWSVPRICGAAGIDRLLSQRGDRRR